MIYDCGILDDEPWNNRKIKWISRTGWTKPEFPEDVRRELAILLATPGFPVSYLIRVLHVTRRRFMEFSPLLPGYDELAPEVHENWISVTEQDAIKLAHLRRGLGDVPLVCQLRMLDALKAGRSRTAVARQFGVSRGWLYDIEHEGISAARFQLPQGFDTLVRYAHQTNKGF